MQRCASYLNLVFLTNDCRCAQLINNRNLFFTVLETGKSKSKVLCRFTKYIYSIWWGPTSWFINSHLPHCILTQQKGQGRSFGVSFCKSMDSIYEGPTLRLNYRQKAPTPNINTLGIWSSTHTWGQKHSVHNILSLMLDRVLYPQSGTECRQRLHLLMTPNDHFDLFMTVWLLVSCIWGPVASSTWFPSSKGNYLGFLNIFAWNDVCHSDTFLLRPPPRVQRHCPIIAAWTLNSEYTLSHPVSWNWVWNNCSTLSGTQGTDVCVPLWRIGPIGSHQHGAAFVF